MAESLHTRPSVHAIVRGFLTENFTLGATFDLDDSASLVESGVLDSTGVTELVAFLEQTFSINIQEEDMVAENLDSVERICFFIAILSARSDA